jgi:hypothetical protein
MDEQIVVQDPPPVIDEPEAPRGEADPESVGT